MLLLIRGTCVTRVRIASSDGASLCLLQSKATPRRSVSMLGNMHCQGEGGPVDFAEARRLLGLAAAQGDDGAQCLLGNMHYAKAGR